MKKWKNLSETCRFFPWNPEILWDLFKLTGTGRRFSFEFFKEPDPEVLYKLREPPRPPTLADIQTKEGGAFGVVNIHEKGLGIDEKSSESSWDSWEDLEDQEDLGAHFLRFLHPELRCISTKNFSFFLGLVFSKTKRSE